MNIFFDFEFIENGSAHSMEPISVGLIRDDNKTYYAEFSDVPWHLANDWVIENVEPHLHQETLKNKETIAKEIQEFVGEKPKFWAYFASYDWVLLCQLYGKMIDLPKNWPFYCLDIKQYMYHTNTRREELDFIGNETEHHALADATWNKKVYDYLTSRGYVKP